MQLYTLDFCGSICVKGIYLLRSSMHPVYRGSLVTTNDLSLSIAQEHRDGTLTLKKSWVQWYALTEVTLKFGI